MDDVRTHQADIYDKIPSDDVVIVVMVVMEVTVTMYCSLSNNACYGDTVSCGNNPKRSNID